MKKKLQKKKKKNLQKKQEKTEEKIEKDKDQKIEIKAVSKSNSKLKKIRRKQDIADKIDNGIDGLGTSTLPQSGVKVTKPLIVTDSPYTITECNQMLMFSAEYIEDLRDFRKRKPAFFMVNVYSIFMFESKKMQIRLFIL